MSDDQPISISLLWQAGTPPEERGDGAMWTEDALADVGLRELAGALCADAYQLGRVEGILRQLCADVQTIRYRQEICADFMRLPELVRTVEALLPTLASIAEYRDWHTFDTPLYQTLARLGELELYVMAVKQLAAALRAVEGDLRSQGLGKLRQIVEGLASTPEFERLAAELPSLSAQVRDIASVTIGVNLDEKLRPIEATITAINTTRFRGRDNFFSRMLTRKDESTGLGPLHAVPMKSMETRQGRIAMTERENPLLFPLFRDLDQLVGDIAKPIAAAIRQYTRMSSSFLAALQPELIFYIGAVRLAERLRGVGLPICMPTPAAPEERRCQVSEAYNLLLAVRLLGKRAQLGDVVVTNEIDFGPEGRIGILTGPNSGGKTTYTQGVALLQLCFQAGIFVAGSSATISPVDGIYTHFASDERPELEAGRLGQEAAFLSAIFDRATRLSLVLLNESLSSTSPGEALYLARDLVRALRRLGARGIFATHLHELAVDIDQINRETPGDSLIVSLVSGVAEVGHDGSGNGHARRTYKVVKAPPLGRSFAHEVASQYGISYEKLVEKLAGRRLLLEP